MTDRDYFAAAAMCGWIANGDWHEGEIPRRAYQMADAMLAERGQERLTEKEREAMESALDFCERTDKPLPTSDQITTLRGLLKRLGGGA